MFHGRFESGCISRVLTLGLPDIRSRCFSRISIRGLPAITSQIYFQFLFTSFVDVQSCLFDVLINLGRVQRYLACFYTEITRYKIPNLLQFPFSLLRLSGLARVNNFGKDLKVFIFSSLIFGTLSWALQFYTAFPSQPHCFFLPVHPLLHTRQFSSFLCSAISYGLFPIPL